MRYLSGKTCNGHVASSILENCLSANLIADSLHGRELYDVSADPHETNDLSEANQKLVASLASRMDEFADGLERRVAVEIRLDERRLRELESLGYVSSTKRP